MENLFLKFLIIHSSWVFFPVEECIINIIYMYSSHLLVKLTFGALLTLDVWVKMGSQSILLYVCDFLTCKFSVNLKYVYLSTCLVTLA